MRDYAKVAPQFWTGKTGKALKAAGPEAVIVGMYLMTSPHANMIGVYHCPVGYISIDTGLTIEGATKGLQCAIEADFCTFDEDSGYVFVHEFAAYQIGDELDPKDKRVLGVQNELAKVPKNQCWRGFRARYAVPFHLPTLAKPSGVDEAPSKPLGSQEQEQKKEQEQEQKEEKGGEKKKSSAFDASAIELPSWLDRGLWQQWAADRRKRGKAITEIGAAKQIEKLDEYRQAGMSPQDVLDHAMASGNQGLFPPPRMPTTNGAGKHTGFAMKNYREGIEADGTLI